MKKFWAEVPASEDVQGKNDDNDATEDNTFRNIHQELSVSAKEPFHFPALFSPREIFQQAAIFLSRKDSTMKIPLKLLTFVAKSDKRMLYYVLATSL